MRFRSWYVPLVIMLMACQFSDASEIIEPSDYHADEAKTKPGASWLALQPFKGGWRLVSAGPRFISIPDEISGTGIRVKSGVKNTLVLLADKSLSPGSVGKSLGGGSSGASPEQKFESSRLPNIGEAKEFVLNGRRYTLSNSNGKLSLISQGTSQPLFDYSEEFDNNATIVWIGDLDRDGRLDLIVDASDHYNVGELRLYLSGRARSGSLVKLVASRRTTGC